MFLIRVVSIWDGLLGLVLFDLFWLVALGGWIGRERVEGVYDSGQKGSLGRFSCLCGDGCEPYQKEDAKNFLHAVVLGCLGLKFKIFVLLEKFLLSFSQKEGFSRDRGSSSL